MFIAQYKIGSYTLPKQKTYSMKVVRNIEMKLHVKEYLNGSTEYDKFDKIRSKKGQTSAMAGGVAVWDIINFQFLLQQHVVSDVLLARQVVMIQVSTSSLHTLVKHLWHCSAFPY